MPYKQSGESRPPPCPISCFPPSCWCFPGDNSRTGVGAVNLQPSDPQNLTITPIRGW